MQHACKNCELCTPFQPENLKKRDHLNQAWTVTKKKSETIRI
jgi:hypothetical protein